MTRHGASKNTQSLLINHLTDNGDTASRTVVRGLVKDLSPDVTPPTSSAQSPPPSEVSRNTDQKRSSHSSTPSASFQEEKSANESKRRRSSRATPPSTSSSGSQTSTRSSSMIKTPNDRPSKRTFKGRVELYETCLPVSDGTVRVQGAVWPKKPHPTTQNVLSQIQCDLCKGWLHWACSGVADGLDMEEVEWFCAECQVSVTHGLGDRVVEFTGHRCVRPGCILRDHKAVKRWEEEDEIVYLVERFIGRRKGEYGIEYLVKWESWDIADSTWESENVIDCVERHAAALFDRVEEEGKDNRKHSVLLEEAEEVIRSGKDFMTAAEWALKYCG